MRTVLLRTFVVVAASIATSAQSSVTALNIQSCFNPLLQQKMDYSSDIRLSLASLSQITENTYEESKHDVGLAGRYKFLAFSLNYEDFDKKRREYFNLNKLNIDYYRGISLSTRTLDAGGYTVIKDCIDQVARTQYGFHYVYYLDGANKAAIQFFWNPTAGGSREVKVTDSWLDNATASTTEKSKYRDKLFPWVSRWSPFPYPRIGASSEVIFLTRKNVSDSIRISLSVDPSTDTGPPIIIPAVPQPIIDPECKTVFDKNEPFTHAEYKIARNFNDNDYITDAHGCSDCHGYVVGFDTPGLIWKMECHTQADNIWQESCTGEGTTHAQSSGYQNANPKQIYVTAWYQIPRQQCTFQQDSNTPQRSQ